HHTFVLQLPRIDDHPSTLFPLLFFTPRRPPRPSLFPYTTLFRSVDRIDDALSQGWSVQVRGDAVTVTDPEETARLTERAYTRPDRKSTRLNSSHVKMLYAVVCLLKQTILIPLMHLYLVFNIQEFN